MNTSEVAPNQDLLVRLRDLDRLVLAGDILGAFDKYYADEVVMREGNSEPVRGKTANRARLEGFLASLQAFNGATLHSYGVGKDVTLSEYTFDLVAENGAPLIWNEVIRRQWVNGKVVDERYYTAG